MSPLQIQKAGGQLEEAELAQTTQAGLPSHREAGKHTHVLLSASLVGSGLRLRIRGIPSHRTRVQILGSQKEEQRIIYDSRC